MAVQQQLGDYNHCKCPLPHQRKTLSQLNPTLRALSKSQNWLAGPWLDWSLWQWNRTFTKRFCRKIISFLPYRHPPITHTPIIWIAAKLQAKMNYRCFSWKKLSLLQTLGNDDTNLRTLQCPLEGELTVFSIWLISLNSLIKSEILIAMGMVWPVSSDKWKAPLVISQAGHRQSDVKPSLCNEVG